MSGEDQSHKIRLSIDIQSLRNNNFQGNIYVKYGDVPSLGIKRFKTPSTVQLFKKHIEEQYVTDGFCSYEFEATKDQLLNLVREQKLVLEVWHADRLQKDELVGKATVSLADILKFPIKKTKQSYVRIYDAFHSIDQYAEETPIGKLGELRVIVYLEDLGPSVLLAGRQEELQDAYRQETEGIRMAGDRKVDTGDMAKLPLGQALEDDGQQKAIFRELADIESKVIWELENWKRAEEARFRFNLKQKEAEHVERMRAEWRQKELDRERVFKETENKMAGHAQKMQAKVNQLSKREHRLILLEEELKQKIGETSRQLAQKDEDVEEHKAKTGEERKVLLKKAKDLEDKNKKLEEIIKNLEEDLRLYKIEQEKSPIEIVKKELNEKVIEIAQLRKEIDKTDEIKEEYRKHFERLKDEVIKLKRERDQAIVEANTKHDKEIGILRNQLGQISTMGQQGNTYNTLREELMRIKGGTGGADFKSGQDTHPMGGPGYLHPSTIPRDHFGTAQLSAQQGGGYNEPRFTANSQAERPTDQSGAYKDPYNFSNLRRLMNERTMLLKQGYLENDPLVTQIDEAIKQLKS